jgi:hypothetical protein
MAELDKIPQKQSIDLETVKLEAEVVDKIKSLNGDLSALINDFGQIYIRKKELNTFKDKSRELKGVVDSLEEKYPRHQIDLEQGTVIYQPGAPSRIQQTESASK